MALGRCQLPQVPDRQFLFSGFAKLYYLCAPFQKDGIFLKRPNKGSASAETPQRCTHKLGKMPKVKTNSSAKKRFKVTATGKITHQKSFKRHILTKKSKRRKRAMRIDSTVHKSNENFVKRLLRLK